MGISKSTKTKTEAILLANHYVMDVNNPMNQSLMEGIKYVSQASSAGRRLCEQVMFGFGFTDWLRKWHEFF